MSDADRTASPEPRASMSWRARVVAGLSAVIAIVVVWFTDQLLTERYTAATRNRAELRHVLYAGNLLSDLQRHQTVPLFLGRDPLLIGALSSDDYRQSSQRLIDIKNEIGAALIMMLDVSGRTVASTDRNLIGSTHRSAPFFLSALRSNDTTFSAFENEAGLPEFSYSRRIEGSGELIGVIVVVVDLRKFEQTWSPISDAVLVLDSEGKIILATESQWRGKTEQEALSEHSSASLIERAIRFTADWAALPSEADDQGGALMRVESRIPFQGWRMVSFTTHASVRARVIGILALEVTGFAILLAAGFYFSSRRAQARSVFFQRESAKLRKLNEALQREITERQKAEKSLEVAEQTLAQSSKLAVLGEMSAGVSHELNQPLAAMKTYLAGAKLLLQRGRSDEALSSFDRADDLLERMGAITWQLKSYARKGEDELTPIDARECVSSAISMMEPQLKSRSVLITSDLPPAPVMVLANRMRLDQVLINLLRNAVDATKEVDDPSIDVTLAAGDMATLTVRDNGPGVADLENLFEPFYTTKAPGDGVGLGLAISSSIINGMKGRLTARNGRAGGAVFEVRLMLHKNQVNAAE